MSGLMIDVQMGSDGELPGYQAGEIFFESLCDEVAVTLYGKGRPHLMTADQCELVARFLTNEAKRIRSKKGDS